MQKDYWTESYFRPNKDQDIRDGRHAISFLMDVFAFKWTLMFANRSNDLSKQPTLIWQCLPFYNLQEPQLDEGERGVRNRKRTYLQLKIHVPTFL